MRRPPKSEQNESWSRQSSLAHLAVSISVSASASSLALEARPIGGRKYGAYAMGRNPILLVGTV
jgi:hypothetical protein